MTGPRRIVTLDGLPRDRWRLDHRSAFLLSGQLWHVVEAGCLQCLDQRDATGHTLVTEDSMTALCTDHGKLAILAYTVTRSYRVTVGTAWAEGERLREFQVFVPTEMVWAIRDLLLKQFLAEAEAHEIERLAE